MKTERAIIDRPLGVLVYTDSAGIGGAEISLSHLVATISDDINVTVVGTSRLVVDAITERRPLAARIVLPTKGPLSGFAHLAAMYRLQPDVVHINLCTPWAGATGLATALSLPTTRVVRVDQLPLRTTDPLTLWRTRMLSLRVDAHVAVGEASARKMEDFYALGRGTVRSIHNAVPDITGEPSVPPARPDGQLVVGSIGRLDRMKAHDVLLLALAQVHGMRAVILGEGEQRSALLQLAAELGVSERLDLLGWVDNPRVHLAGFDIMALPSRSEGFPLAVVEAMLAARPVVATRVGSVAEAIIDGETGFLVDKEDVDGLATALRRLRDDSKLRERLGWRGREVAKAHFTVEHMSANYERLWHEVMSAPRTPRLRVPRPRD
ncbi:MAG: glycosyltransferase [Chroococcidiopsidaceae cyanobacterium CP_BM_RX_35]|nr:glycosyltransferase [Chroococcidiopsidaceae cyanobacterium CP_BM_RX_35]